MTTRGADPGEFVKTVAHCRRCGLTLAAEAVQVWGGEIYCCGCTTAEGLPEQSMDNDLPCEQVCLTVKDALRRVFWSWIILGGSLGTIIFGGFLTVHFLNWIAGNHKQNLDTFALGAAYFALFTAVFLSVVIVTLSSIVSLGTRCRAIAIVDGRFVQKCVLRRSILLAECSWRVVSIGCDRFGFYAPARLISITSKSDAFVCGFTPQALAMWRGYFRLANVAERKSIRWLQTWPFVPLGASLGLAVGLLVGGMAQLLTGNAYFVIACGLLGILDGMTLGCCCAVCALRTAQLSLEQERFRRWLWPVTAFQFGGLGVLLMIGQSVMATFTVAACNAMIGGIGSVLSQRCARFKADEY